MKTLSQIRAKDEELNNEVGRLAEQLKGHAYGSQRNFLRVLRSMGYSDYHAKKLLTIMKKHPLYTFHNRTKGMLHIYVLGNPMLKVSRRSPEYSDESHDQKVR